MGWSRRWWSRRQIWDIDLGLTWEGLRKALGGLEVFVQ